ncbi:hypothetical protein DRJ19_05680, partial [Candidatus Woesearchaeota archaeon]
VYALTDGVGEVVEAYQYDIYGQPRFYDGAGQRIERSQYGNVFMFTGRYWEGPLLHLYYYRARYYSPQLDRFLQRDPLWELLLLMRPFACDYLYCRAQVTKLRDPIGLECCPNIIYAIMVGVAGKPLDDIGEMRTVFGKHLKPKGYKFKFINTTNSKAAEVVNALQDPKGAGYLITGGHGDINPQGNGEARIELQIIHVVGKQKKQEEIWLTPGNARQMLEKRRKCPPKFIIWAFCYSGGVDDDWVFKKCFEWFEPLEFNVLHTFSDKNTTVDAWVYNPSLPSMFMIYNIGRLEGLGIGLVKTWRRKMAAGDVSEFLNSQSFKTFLQNMPRVKE